VLEQVLDEHPELGAPVAKVILPDDLGGVELQHPGEGVADDRAAQVADVHLLGNVGLGVVDHCDAAGVMGWYPQPGVLAPQCDLPPDRRVGQGQVEEPRPGDLAPGNQVVVLEPGRDRGCQLAGVGSQRLGQGKDAVALVVRVVRRPDLRVRASASRGSPADIAWRTCSSRRVASGVTMVIVVRAVPLEKIRLGTGSCLPSCQVPLGPRLSIISARTNNQGHYSPTTGWGSAFRSCSR
jgi:hypothetical protein